MKLEQLHELGGIHAQASRDGQPPAPERKDPAQGLINDLLEFRARCVAAREQAMPCGEVVRELDKMIRKNYGAMTDI